MVQQLITTDPTNPDNYFRLAKLYEDSGLYAEAEQVYRAELDDHPHNGWSLFGLKTALNAQGKSSPEVDRDLAASWARADTWLQASRF